MTELPLLEGIDEDTNEGDNNDLNIRVQHKMLLSIGEEDSDILTKG